MRKTAQLIALITLFALFVSEASAYEVTKVKGKSVLFRLDGETVKIGDQLDAVDSNGARKGVVQVTKFNQKSALGKIANGSAEVGMKLMKRPDSSDSPSSNTPLDLGESPNTYNVRVNPIGLIFGEADLDFDFKIASDWTVGPEALYLHTKISSGGNFTSDYDIAAFGFGARANWFYNGVYKDGFYVGPALRYVNIDVKTSDINGSLSGSVSAVMASCLLGYGWYWTNFNVMLGAGYATSLGAATITVKDAIGDQETISTNLSGIDLEVSLGYAF